MPAEREQQRQRQKQAEQHAAPAPVRHVGGQRGAQRQPEHGFDDEDHVTVIPVRVEGREGVDAVHVEGIHAEVQQ